jgi:signal transduction histidine kinase
MRHEVSEPHAGQLVKMTDLQPIVPPDWRHWALAGADLGAFAFDVGTQRLKLDSRAAELLGVKEDEITFDDYLRVVDPVHRTRVAEHVKAALEKDGGAYHDEFRTSAKRWVAADGRLRRKDATGGICLVGVLSDTTLRRTTDDARARLIDEMARSLRFSEMLIGVVGQDIDRALASIAASTENVRRSGPDSTVHTAATRIRNGAEGIAGIMAQLLDLTRARIDGQTPLRLRETNLVTMVRDVASEAMARDPRTAIDVEARGEATCTCDSDRTSQIFANLIANAVRHGIEPRDIRVLIDGTQPRTVSVTVTNSGVIPSELTPTLFNPFRRMRPEQRSRNGSHGLGLSLYIAKRIALGHGGDISVTSSPEHGTSFRLELPRVATSAAFSLTPDRDEEEAISLEGLGVVDSQSRVTAALFGVLPVEQRAPEAFAVLVDRHLRVLELALERQIYRDAHTSVTGELRTLAEQLGTLGAGAGDVADLHAQALKKATHGAPALKVQALVSEGRLLALELMGRLVMFYRKRSGFGSLTRGGRSETD